MIKSFLLKFHRWTSVVFALPLLIIIATGFVLSFEPMLQANAIAPQSVDMARLVDLIQTYNPSGSARGLAIHSAEHRLKRRRYRSDQR